MKKALIAAAALVALPMASQAQSLQPGGFYIGAEGGLNWLLNNSFTATVAVPGAVASGNVNGAYNTGWLAGGMIGYDFIGPRVELEGVYRNNTATLTIPTVAGSFGGYLNQVSIMANVLYDFNAGGMIVPYIGAGAGVAFLTAGDSNGGSSNATAFAYQAIAGLGWNIDTMFRVNLEGRYYGTTTPTYNYSSSFGGNAYTVNSAMPNQNFSLMASIQLKFGDAPAAAPPPPPVVAPPSFMVFFDWDRSNLSAQALNTIKQAAQAYKTKGNARITATGHTDTSGPEAYNMALSLRRANTVKDALVREGVPATAIAVIGRGEAGLLVKTADGVREPQNRRVEIVIQ